MPGKLGHGRRRSSHVNVEQAVFLVGGLGSRLRGLTSERAKPMLDVGGRPFLDYLLDEASRYGIKRALLLCGYRAGDLTSIYNGRTIRGMRIETVVEASPAGTAGALALAADRLDEDFFLVNGDSLFDFNWLALCPAPGDAIIKPGAHGPCRRRCRHTLRTGGRRWPESADFRRIRTLGPADQCRRLSHAQGDPVEDRYRALLARARCSAGTGDGRPDRGLRRRRTVHRYRHPRGLRARANPRSLHPEATRRVSRSRRRAERGHGLRSPQRPGPLGRRRARNGTLAERCGILRLRRDQSGRRRARLLQRRPCERSARLDESGAAQEWRAYRLRRILPLPPRGHRRALPARLGPAQARSRHGQEAARRMAGRRVALVPGRRPLDGSRGRRRGGHSRPPFPKRRQPVRFRQEACCRRDEELPITIDLQDGGDGVFRERAQFAGGGILAGLGRRQDAGDRASRPPERPGRSAARPARPPVPATPIPLRAGLLPRRSSWRVGHSTSRADGRREETSCLA